MVEGKNECFSLKCKINKMLISFRKWCTEKKLLHLSVLYFSFTRLPLCFIQLKSSPSMHIALPAETQSLDNTSFLFLLLKRLLA